MSYSFRVASLGLVLFLGSAASAAVASPAIGRPAPSFALTTVDGRAVTLASFLGKTLVINVWGSWCPPCRLETPDLVAEADAQRRNGVAFLGIDTTETAAVVRAYAAAKGIAYPQVATTSRSAFARDYGITNYPTTIVIDPSGIVRAVHADNILPRRAGRPRRSRVPSSRSSTRCSLRAASRSTAIRRRCSPTCALRSRRSRMPMPSSTTR